MKYIITIIAIVCMLSACKKEEKINDYTLVLNPADYPVFIQGDSIGIINNSGEQLKIYEVSATKGIILSSGDTLPEYYEKDYPTPILLQADDTFKVNASQLKSSHYSLVIDSALQMVSWYYFDHIYYDGEHHKDFYGQTKLEF